MGMSINIRVSAVLLVAAVLSWAPDALGQDAVAPVVPEAPADAAGPATVDDVEPAPVQLPEETTEIPPEQPAAPDDGAPAEAPPAEPAQEAPAAAPEASEAEPEGGAAEEAEAAEPTDWRGLMERLPALMSVMHSAAVHLPIALWLFGAMFVVIGAVAPSLRNQVPIACLVGGAIFSIFAVLTGWWCAEYEYAADWNDFDWEETLVVHRWSAIGTMAASFVLSLMALTNLRRKSAAVGFLWRIGLIALAVAVGWVGHLGGELIKYEGFFEEALEIWLNGE